MALLKCSECGREISDKAVSCPGCGCPVSEIEGMSQKDEKINSLVETVKRIHRIYPTGKIKAIKELRKCTGLDLAEATNIINKEYNGEGILALATEYEENKNTVLLSFRLLIQKRSFP